MKSSLTIAATLMAAFALAGVAHAQTNVALGKTVTSTAFYDQGSETFPASNLTDGRLDDTGSPSNWSFWLTPNNTDGTATIDLGSTFTLDSFSIQNTLNRGYQDRETNGLNVYVSNTAPVFGNVASYGTQVQSYNFTNTEGTGVIPTDTFSIAPTTGRYITVDVTSHYGASGGLNEVQAFGAPAAISAAPEPAVWGLMIAGLAMMGGALRLRRRQTGVLAA